MTRRFITTGALALMAAGSAHAGTFDRVAIAPQSGVEVFTRETARNLLDRDLFSNPYSSVVLATIDVYDTFPYLESRYFQIVSDPGWNRLLLGETGTGLAAFDGTGTAVGPLREPRGLAVSADGRVFLADTGNNRVLILKAITEFDSITLEPVGVIEGLHRPYDVAFSDFGTPEPGDDRLYVADTGRNQVVSYRLDAEGARRLHAIGTLGSGTGHFAGPMAIAVGRTDDHDTATLFVADAHNRRVVQLTETGTGLAWTGEGRHDFDVVTSLDTDPWGNLYLAGPNRGLQKFSPAFEPLTEPAPEASRPRDFHVVYARVQDHARNTVTRGGRAQGVLLDRWSATSGLSLYELGLEVRSLTVDPGDGVRADFLLTDRATVTASIVDPISGQVVARRNAGIQDAGSRSLAFTAEDFTANLQDRPYTLRVEAVSAYENGPTAREESTFEARGTGYALTGRPLLLGNHPNPFRGATQIQFVVPEGPAATAQVRVFDIQGRQLRTLLDGSVAPGVVGIAWDGRDGAGRPAPAGIYFYRVTVGETILSSKMILVD